MPAYALYADATSAWFMTRFDLYVQANVYRSDSLVDWQSDTSLSPLMMALSSVSSPVNKSSTADRQHTRIREGACGILDQLIIQYTLINNDSIVAVISNVGLLDVKAEKM